MQKILAARSIFPDIVEHFEQHFEVDWNDGDMLPHEALTARLADKDGALTTGDPISAATPRLRVVANMAVGYNNFNMAAFNAANVFGTYTPDVLNETTADFGWALMMATARHIVEFEHWLRSGQWRKWFFYSFLGSEVYGAMLGVIGMGRIGQALDETLCERRIAATSSDMFEGVPSGYLVLLEVLIMVLTPHIASATEAVHRAIANLAVDNLIAVLGIEPCTGRSPNPVHPDVISKARA
ncbi:MAG: NAD(P)-dependent oxidoreductase [Burkholderia sp.]|nr:MAG: Glyoxylate/hydroxypyruvate reductase B [Burkholderia gladioli]